MTTNDINKTTSNFEIWEMEHDGPMNDINKNMSNFEVWKMIRDGVSIATISARCDWKTDEIKKRIIAAQRGIERSESSAEVKTCTTKKIIRRVEEIKRRMGSSKFRNLFSVKKSNAHATHATGTNKGIEYLKRYNISGKRNSTSGIDISLDNGDTIAVRASGDRPGSVFLIQGELTNLISSHIMIIRNMNDKEPSFYILDKNTAIDLSSKSYYTKDGNNSWFIYPGEYTIFKDNIEVIKG